MAKDLVKQNLQKVINRDFAADKLLLENITKNTVNKTKVIGIIKFFNLIKIKLVLFKINHLMDIYDLTKKIINKI